MPSSSPRPWHLLRFALLATVAMVLGAAGEASASQKPGCCRDRRPVAECCCKPAARPGVETVAAPTHVDGVRVPSCRCESPERAPADPRSASISLDERAESASRLVPEFASVPPEFDAGGALPILFARKGLPLYLRLVRLLI
ncbi:hypothetical protein TA3x_003620 [Tundrisphaera sp. TA3]|uniref:hypothetical protein n=1 Tax=Tundrisphaera sp. TA3 TaxID=3435775 RepID=UPI003EBAB0C4